MNKSTRFLSLSYRYREVNKQFYIASEKWFLQELVEMCQIF